MLIGTAKPMPMLPSARPLLMIAVLMPMTSPRMFSSGPPELPGLIAASVCSISFDAAVGHRERPLGRADDADADRVREAERVADRHHPVARLPSATSRRTWLPAAACFGFSVSWISALSVSGSRPITFAVYVRLVVAVEDDLDLGRVLDDVVVGEDEAVLADDEAGARRARRSARAGAGWLLPPPLSPPWPWPWPPGSAEEAPEEVVGAAAAAAEEVLEVLRLRLHLGPDVDDHRRLRLGDVAERVGASSGPVSGALFIGGTAIVCADDAGVRSSREAMTMPTASDAMTMSGR